MNDIHTLRRLKLQSLFEDILGSEAVYFQSPGEPLLKYPCIIYSNVGVNTRYGNNLPYLHEREYKVTLITKDPDDTVYLKICDLPKSRLTSRFTEGNLNHTVITLFY